MVRIIIGADHAGVELKKAIVSYLDKKHIYYEDIGGFDKGAKDDYPDYAFKVGEKVARDPSASGILICGSGTGMCIAANKVKGVRASLVYDSYTAKKAKEDNNVNIICLRGKSFSPELAKKLVNIWLETPFSDETRHKIRLLKISKYKKGKI